MEKKKNKKKEPFDKKCQVKIFENNNEILKIECSLNENLTNLREKIMNENYEEFSFLNLIEESNEINYKIKEIIKNGKIEIKSKENNKKKKK